MDLRQLEDHAGGEVHHRADGGEVVEGHQRVHFVLGRAQQPLNHNETDGLKHDPNHLKDEADEDELDLA